MGIGQVLTMPLFFASNAIYPMQMMPGWLRSIAAANPLTYLVDALRGLMIQGGESIYGIGWDCGVLLLVHLGLLAVATWAYPRERPARDWASADYLPMQKLAKILPEQVVRRHLAGDQPELALRLAQLLGDELRRARAARSSRTAAATCARAASSASTWRARADSAPSSAPA